MPIDFSNLLENPGDYDVKIIVGEGENIKEFRAHSLILSSRSTYFKKGLSAQWARKNDDGIIIFNKPNISPLVFEIIMKYIYTGLLHIENNNEIGIFDVAIAADELELLEAFQQLEEILTENKSAWRTKDIIKVCQLDHFTNLYDFTIELVSNNPKMIFDTEEYLKMEETSLIKLLKCNELKLEEIKIWEYLIKWGIKNTNSILDDNITKWTSIDFINLEQTIHNCIPHIRFFQMSPNDYTKIRTQFKDILPNGLDEEVLQYFSNPDFKTTFNVLPSRSLFDSKIINSKDAAIIASWIDKKQGAFYNFKNIPFKLKLIYRASQEGFEINKFHDKCDNKGPTVVVIKVRGSGEIIGGYNPLEWRSFKILEDERSPLLYHNRDFYINHQHESSNSFIFSLANQKIPILSRVTFKREAITWCKDKGPCFGFEDLFIYSLNGNTAGKSKQYSYEKEVINKENFEIEEYEVFQIIDDRLKSIVFQFINRMFRSIKRMFERVIRFIERKFANFLLPYICLS
ncbi:BTB/POZ domain-containing protein [Rhizophagus clarus]|uniref:BTB/POZ domain-containing protein n=1 Tax=Rhizophagus clarus TaxID=94130 RepID=A0A8H3R175_9GLOM|nr:BTB/POZ domain-containing protein [Rhizophagus clarus]